MSIEDLLEFDGEIDFGPNSGSTGPTVGFKTTTSANENLTGFSSPPQEDRNGISMEPSYEAPSGSLGLEHTIANNSGDEESYDESFYVESIFNTDVRRIKAPIVQLEVRGTKRVFLPDSSDGNSVFFFDTNKGVREKVFNFPEDEIFRGKCLHVNRDATHAMVIGTNTSYYVNMVEPNFAPFPLETKKTTQKDSITAVKFDGLKKANSKSSGPIILGTKNGILYEVSVEIDPKKNKPVSTGLIKLFDLNDKSVRNLISVDGGITGIGVIVTKKKKKATNTPGMENAQGEDSTVMSVTVLVSVGSGIIEFRGETGINSYKNLFDMHIDNKNEVKVVSTGESSFPSNGPLCIVKGMYVKQWSFVCLTNAGMLQGNVSHSKGIGETRIITSDDMIYDVKADEFHIYVLMEKKVLVFRHPPGLCIGDKEKKLPLDEVLIHYEYQIPADWGRIKGFQMENDPGDEEIRWIYIYSSRGVHRVNISVKGSLKNIWRLYLHKAIENREEKMFNVARALSELCEDEREINDSLDIILSAKAELYFERDQYLKAAQTYAQTSKNFAEIAFKFHSVEETGALQEFLLLTLERISQEDYGKENTTQLVCLCTWLVELFLCQLDRPCNMHQECSGKKICKPLQKKFKGFLSKYKNNFHAPTVKRLILSHGQLSLNLFYAKLSKDYETVIGHYLLKNSPSKALGFLRSTCVHKKYQNVWYHFIGELILKVPNKTVKLLKDSRLKFLSIGKILPNLLKVISTNKDSEINKEILDYLYFALDTFRSKNKTLHNLIVSLECEKTGEEEEISLLSFLKKSKYYSKSYALRKCLSNNKIKSSLYLFSVLELWEDGVDLALKINDIDKAKTFAESCSSISQSKRLWTKIAKQVLKTYSVKESLKLLYSESTTNPYLKFEKLLSYFPDSVLISDFKTEICKALENYNQEINSLKNEMVNQAQDLKFIRDEIKLIRYSHFTVKQNRKCDSCGVVLTAKDENDIILFPCTHSFHYDCLKKEVSKFTKLDNKTPEQISEIITSECLYCGSRKISTITDEFIVDKTELGHWKIFNNSVDVLSDLIQESDKESTDDDDDDVVDDLIPEI